MNHILTSERIRAGRGATLAALDGFMHLAIVSTSVLLVAGCAADLVPRAAVPSDLVDQASVPDLQHVRYWGDSKPGAYKDFTSQRVATIRKLYGPNAAKISRTSTALTLSGGGSDGAFGAGLLVGWTERGDRPQFDFVTGISTGAMMAPMAFLGPKYDPQLREAYTTLTTQDVATSQVFAAVVGSTSSLADTAPLRRLIAKYMTAEMLQEIAAEHQKGRMLMIGTTNLDAQRAVIWDIGALAASRHPDALQIIRDLILASAAIPGAFPPVKIRVTANGKQFEELHVDGGVTRQVFLYPPGYSPAEIDKAIGWKVKRRVFIVRNTRIDPEFAVTKDQLLSIASRSISTLIKTQGIGDLYRIHSVAKRDGVDYNLAFIPDDFKQQAKSEFDREYMNALFDMGYQLGRAGYAWQKSPPDLDQKN